MDRTEKLIFGGLFAICLAAVVFPAMELLTIREYATEPASVVTTSYKPSETHVGTGVSSSGKPVTTVSTSDEEWVVVVKTHTGQVVPSRCKDGATFADLSPGQSVVLHRHTSWSGITKRTHVTK